MSDQQQRKGGKNLTTSATRKNRYANYKARRVREQHKLKRILRSNGRVYAEAWAKERGVLGYLSVV